MSQARWKCTTCNVISKEGKLLTALNPFDGLDSITGCPACFAVESVQRVCDNSKCNQLATCGTPTKRGYMWSCHDHWPNKNKGKP